MIREKMRCIVYLLLLVGLMAKQGDLCAQNIDETLYKDLKTEYSELPDMDAKILLPKYFDFFESESLSGFMHKGTSASIVGFEYE